MLIASSAALALSACGGGGSSPPDEQAVIAWPDLSVAESFDSRDAERLRTSPGFRNVNADITYNSTIYRGHPYELIRLHVARSGGLTGAGQLVAAVDDGFRISHEVFEGQTLTAFGDISVAEDYGDHGTHVASLISASETNGLIMGVAPGAALHLSSYLDAATKTNLDLEHMRLGTLDARTQRAVAQNNSWGVLRFGGGELLLSDIQGYIGAKSGTVEEISSAFNHFSGGTALRWRRYFAALESFQDRGVVVWALSNDETLPDADASSSLPVLLPELQESWITVGNGAYNLNSKLEVTEAIRISAPCGQTASFCLFADGTTRAARAGSDSDYAAGTGSSFAAPQVAGAVALVAEAFPDLSPNEWQKRLLASAYNSFPGFEASGTTNFGNGVKKSYSNEWGQGIVDIQAALSPIGSTSLLNGRSVQSSERHSLGTSAISVGAFFGDGLEGMLSSRDVAVFDALNGVFYLNAGQLISSSTTKDLFSEMPVLNTTHRQGGAEAPFAQMGSETRLGDDGYKISVSLGGGGQYLQSALGLSSETVSNSSVLSLGHTTTTIHGRHQLGQFEYEQYGFVGTHRDTPNGSLAGIGGAASLDLGGTRLRVGITQLVETGAYLGLAGSDVFGVPSANSITAMSVAATANLADNLSIFGSLEYGTTQGAKGSGYIDYIDPAILGGYQIGFRAQDLWFTDDALTLSVSQPLRLETGRISMTMPVGRERDGTIRYESIETAMSPSGRQVDLGLAYTFTPAADGAIQFGITYSLDAGHSRGKQGVMLGLGYQQAF
jgi:subtilase-type serine protease